MKRGLLAMLLSVSLTGCATLFGRNQDPITIHSKHKDAVISVNGNEIGKGSVVYSVPRGQTVTLTASKKGCSDRTRMTEQAFAAVAALNLLCLPCWLIDVATGKMRKTSPTDYTINPSCEE